MRHTRFRLGMYYKRNPTLYKHYKEYFDEFNSDIETFLIKEDVYAIKEVETNNRAFIETQIKPKDIIIEEALG